jgi:hypothetical protein
MLSFVALELPKCGFVVAPIGLRCEMRLVAIDGWLWPQR